MEVGKVGKVKGKSRQKPEGGEKIDEGRQKRESLSQKGGGRGGGGGGGKVGQSQRKII